jgi:uncharacterized protein
MSQENVELVREMYRVYNDAYESPGVLDALREQVERFCDPEVEWVLTQGAPQAAASFRGHEGVIEFFRDMLEAFEVVRQEPDEFIEAGDRVVVFVHSIARARSGLTIDERWAHIVTLRGGKVMRLEQYRDRAQALEAAGLRE